MSEPNPNLLRNLFTLSFDIFPKIAGADPNPKILGNFCLLEIRPGKKSSQEVSKFTGGGGQNDLDNVQTRAAFFHRGFPNLSNFKQI